MNNTLFSVLVTFTDYSDSAPRFSDEREYTVRASTEAHACKLAAQRLKRSNDGAH
jgi:hypothetical protein